jgi:putative tryptophan/tyrosine transport system substrate-binding protein
MQFDHLRRREFVTLLGGAAAAWPLTVSAQKLDRIPRIGMLMGLAENDPEGQRWVQTFIQALQELGWRSGTNVRIDLRWATDLDHMRTFAKELIELQPDLIQVATTLATAEVLRQTRTIPVVFTVVSDPVGSGFVQNLPRPGGNATGFINIESSLGGKWLNLLREIAPGVTRVAMLFNPGTAPQTAYYRGPLESAAASLGIAATATPIREPAEIETTIAALGQDPQSGLIVLPDFFVASHRDLITSLAARHRVAAVYPFRFFVRAGGLVSYGVDLPDLQRRAASYVDRILKGATPADLPVQLPTKFELAINLKTAKALGLTVPPTLLALADEVIE